MKVIVLVLIDGSEMSRKFKEIQLTNLCEYGHTYFIYGESNNNKTTCENMENNSGNCDISFDKESKVKSRVSYNLYSDIIINKKESFKNMIYKTVNTLEYLVNNKEIDEDTMILRTNMSTLFDYTKLRKEWLSVSKDIYAGPFIGEVINIPLISGTSIIIGLDKVQDIIRNKENINLELNEDTSLQMLITLPYKTCNVARIDYLDNIILYHKCSVYDTDVYVYRFKSEDRNLDIKRMKDFIKSNFNTTQSILGTSIIKTENSMYNKFFKNPITIGNNI